MKNKKNQNAKPKQNTWNKTSNCNVQESNESSTSNVVWEPLSIQTKNWNKTLVV